jgi:hypothetical protein
LIDASGLKTGLRNKRDGTTYFGTLIQKCEIIPNDFLLNIEQVKPLPRIFKISFNRSDQNYYFKKEDKDMMIYYKLLNNFMLHFDKIYHFLIGNVILRIISYVNELQNLKQVKLLVTQSETMESK